MLTGLAVSYRHLMWELEGKERSFVDSLGWASETLTSTGYGHDGRWRSPLMMGFVVLSQFIGQGFLLVAFPFVVIPFFEERFEVRLPRVLPRLKNYILIYRETYHLDALIDSLEERGVPVVVFEEDEATAKRIRNRGRRVVLGSFQNNPKLLARLKDARAIVANATDELNTSMVMWAREAGYRGNIYALAASPSHTRPLVLAGATHASAPNRILAAALAAKASIRLSPPIVGLDRLNDEVCAAQFRLGPNSPMLGHTLGEAKLRKSTGATLLSVSDPGSLMFSREPEHPLGLGCVIHAVGTPKALQDLGNIASRRTVHLQGPILVIGYGQLGKFVAHSLREAKEHVVVIDQQTLPGVDVVGDALEPSLLKSAGIERARAVVLALSGDSSTILATALIRELSSGVPLIARVNGREQTQRIYRIGADFALSFGDVANDMLLPLILDAPSNHKDSLLKIRAFEASRKVCRPLGDANLYDNLDYNVVAIARGPELLTELHEDDQPAMGDVLYVCGEERELVNFAQRFDCDVHPDDLSSSTIVSMADHDEQQTAAQSMRARVSG